MCDILGQIEKYKNDNIAIYGLSIETEKLLTKLNNSYNIIGLLDSFQTTGNIYSMPIISMQQAIEQNVKLIVVVARPGSCKIIKKKICSTCIEHGISLIDIYGNDLTLENTVLYDIDKSILVSKDKFINELEKYEFISFDLFDTLIMRKVLYSSDVYEILEKKLETQKIIIKNFAQKRLCIEKELSKTFAPTLLCLYDKMIEKYNINCIDANTLAQMEWEIDFNLLVPRYEVCEIIRYLYSKDKKIYIISDSYYQKSQIERILKLCNIYGLVIPIVSCEYKTSKTQNLYGILCQKINYKSCIHVGDDLLADIEYSNRFGLKSYHLKSGIDLMDKLEYMGLNTDNASILDKIKIGIFISCIFNSPFLKDNQDKQIIIDNPYLVGYLFLAPIICDFMFWFMNSIEHNNINSILFGARDGYLIKKLYDIVDISKKSIYFLTSRIAAIRAGVKTEQDIDFIDEMIFSGNISDELKTRFGVDLDNSSIDDIKNYKTIILEKANICRKNYIKYMDNLDIDNGITAFFDFVAKGTTQKYLQNILINPLKGFYFIKLPDENNNIDVCSFYKSDDINKSAIFNDYYILECILTSPKPSVHEFDSFGTPLYENEFRSTEDIKCILEVQDGILDFWKFYFNFKFLSTCDMDKSISEQLLLLIHKIKISNIDFLNLKNYDSFFNRKSRMSDLI